MFISVFITLPWAGNVLLLLCWILYRHRSWTQGTLTGMVFQCHWLLRQSGEVMWKYLSKSTDVSFICGDWKNHLKNSHPSLVWTLNISYLPMLFSSEISGLKSPFLAVLGLTKEMWCGILQSLLFWWGICLQTAVPLKSVSNLKNIQLMFYWGFYKRILNTEHNFLLSYNFINSLWRITKQFKLQHLKFWRSFGRLNNFGKQIFP